MDFSEIGVRSRKTGLRARDSVRRDENNMEDVDDFFRDEQETLVNHEEDRASNGKGKQVSNSGKSLVSPLKSPLNAGTFLFQRRSQFQRHEETDTNDDEFADARENPMLDDNDSDDMEIDDESRGTIKAINDNYNDNNNDNDNDNYNDMDFDFGTPRILESPIDANKSTNSGQRLFVSSDEEEVTDRNIKARGELERNISVRRSHSSRKSINHSREVTDKGSPLKSTLLHSPLHPSMPTSIPSSKPHLKSTTTLRSSARAPAKKVASLTKNIALNKNMKNNKRTESSKARTKAIEYSDNDSFDDDSYMKSDSSEGVREEEQQLAKPTRKKKVVASESESDDDHDDDDGDEAVTKPTERGRGRQSTRAAPSTSITRANKIMRSDSKARKHVVDVEELKKQQSRSASQVRDLEQPTRRSSRVRLPPLAFWRNEKAIYQKTKGDIVPTLQKVVTVDEVVTPLRSQNPSRANSRAGSRMTSRRTSRASSLTRRPRKMPKIDNIIEEDEEDEESDDEEEINGRGADWLKTGFLKVDTFEGHGSDIKSERLVAWAPGTENFSQSVISDSDNFKLAILFDKNREFIATGMMQIPPDGQKSLKSTDTTYFVFYCISGLVEVTLSGNTFMIKKGCSLEIPMGNFYQFVNKGKKDATLFFVQTRGHDLDEWDE